MDKHKNWKTDTATYFHMLNEHAGVTLTGDTAPENLDDPRLKPAAFAAETINKELSGEVLSDSRWTKEAHLALFDDLRSIYIKLHNFDESPLTDAATAYVKAVAADAFDRQKPHVQDFKNQQFHVRHYQPRIEDTISGDDLLKTRATSYNRSTIKFPGSDGASPDESGAGKSGGGSRKGRVA